MNIAFKDLAKIGFPDMWDPVFTKYRLFFEAGSQLEPIVSEMICAPVKNRLLLVVRQTLGAAANTYNSLMILALNGCGLDALKLARSMFEMELDILWLRAHPEDINDFINYGVVHKKKLYDLLSDEDKCHISPEEFDKMDREYKIALPHFAKDRDKLHPRSEWCRESLFKRAQSAGDQYKHLYKIFYYEASALHHCDIQGLMLSTDSDMQTRVVPSWVKLKEVFSAGGTLFRIAGLFNDMAELGFKERLEKGPNEVLIAAMQQLVD